MTVYKGEYSEMHNALCNPAYTVLYAHAYNAVYDHAYNAAYNVHHSHSAK